ncbi:zinc ribbon domain-containing protein [Vibrio campbellii]
MALIISPILAFIILLLRSDVATKTCPKCKEKIKKEAVICKHCGNDAL